MAGQSARRIGGSLARRARVQVELKPTYQTRLGALYQGDCAKVLSHPALADFRGRIQLILTSPPFPLTRKKRYGNKDGAVYRRWLANMAPLFREFLTPTGSLVMELGNAWNPGAPTMSTLPLESLLAFKKKGDLRLCQEFICYNPARLPTPTQWVNVERIRVKDAFTRVWWMSSTDNPKADNHRILTQYSQSMQKLINRGTYNAGRRPSEHHIGERSFLKDNGGAIPPNVLVSPAEAHLPLFEVLPIANTGNTDPYQLYCRKKGIQAHPSRMPEKLAEFFVRFLTEEGDLVLDPFAGSNTTGAVAERLNRRWLAIEEDQDYAAASEVRVKPEMLASMLEPSPQSPASPSSSELSSAS